MKAAYFLGDKRFEVRGQDLILNPQEVLIKVMSAGVCGTDVHIYHGSEGSAKVTPPIVLGHEFAGVVEAVGSEVSKLAVGDHVTVDPNIYCGECTSCRMAKKQGCDNLTALGVNMNGGFAEYCKAPQANCYKISKAVDFDSAAMAEPLACAIHGIDRANIMPGQNVVIVGGGPIGLIMLQLARLCGAATVALSEPQETRRKMALQLGADYAIDPTQGDVAAVYEKLSGNNGADVVIECAGSPAAALSAVKLSAKGASILLFSVPAVDAVMPLPLFDVFKKELKISGSFINPDTHLRAVNLLNSNRLRLKELVSHCYEIENLEKAILMQAGGESGKVMVHCQGK